MLFLLPVGGGGYVLCCAVLCCAVLCCAVLVVSLVVIGVLESVGRTQMWWLSDVCCCHRLAAGSPSFTWALALPLP